MASHSLSGIAMRVLLLLALLIAAGPVVRAQSAASEASGVEAASAVSTPAPAPAAWRGGDTVLVIPESTNDNLILLDATTGDLITAAALTATTGLSTPVNAILDIDGEGFLICDQITDGVYRFSASGVPEGIFAPSGGVNTAILDNVRGCDIRNDTLYVTVASGANADAIARFDATGAFIGNFIEPGGGGLAGPFDVLFRDADVLIPSINSDAIHRYDLAGAFLGAFATGLSFPEQLHETAAGTVLVAEFTLDQLIEYPAQGGAPIGAYSYPGLGGYRGVYELPGGTLIATTGAGVYELRRDGTIVRQIVDGVSARFIEALPAGFVVADAPEPDAGGAAWRVAGPNPFRLQTTLELTVDRAQSVRVTVTDATGRLVATLYDGTLGAGTTRVLTLHGSGLPAGVYALTATGETFSQTRTVTHLR